MSALRRRALTLGPGFGPCDLTHGMHASRPSLRRSLVRQAPASKIRTMSRRGCNFVRPSSALLGNARLCWAKHELKQRANRIRSAANRLTSERGLHRDCYTKTNKRDPRLRMSATETPQSELNELLLRTASRDRRAFEDLYQRTSPRLLGVCTRMLADRSEAEEVLQEAFIAVWQRGHSFDPTRSNALTWLVSLTRNKAIDRLRQRPDAAPESSFDVESVVDEDPTPASQAEQGEEYRRLENCLKELDSKQRRSIQEAFFSGITYPALAARAKVPLGTMKSWIRRGLLQLRECLEA